MLRARLLIGRLPGAGESARLSAAETAHARARRLRPGDPLVLFDGSGRQADARVTRIDRAGTQVRVERIWVEGERGFPLISLCVAAIRAERLAWIAEKATELGVTALTILRTARTQSFRAAPGALARLERVAREAAKQCQSAVWPRIIGPLTLDELLIGEPESRRFFFDPEGEPMPQRLGQKPAILVVGPEGGWTGAERASAVTQGWSLTRLPGGKLRTETAALAAMVLARAAFERKT